MTDDLKISLSDILLPTDFTEGSHVAFAHALKFALATKGKLRMIHVEKHNEETQWSEFPQVRHTLENWGLIEKGCGKEAIAALGFDVRKAIIEHKNPVDACLDFLETHDTDLLVLATRQVEGPLSWFGQRFSKPIARGAGIITAFFPSGKGGYVDPQTGEVSLKHILIPLDKERPQRAVQAAARLANAIDLPELKFTLLHCGPEGSMPHVDPPQRDGWSWNRIYQDGEPAETIIAYAEESGVDQIIMTTDGGHGFLDALRGSTSERVLRGTPCPVAVIPPGT